MPAAKQVIVIRRDLGMRRGKEIAQGSHASQMWLNALLFPKRSLQHFMLSDEQQDWLAYGHAKVVCQVPDLDALIAVYDAAEAAGLTIWKVRDAGHTEVEPGTITAIAVGPNWSYLVDPVTSGLELY